MSVVVETVVVTETVTEVVALAACAGPVGWIALGAVAVGAVAVVALTSSNGSTSSTAKAQKTKTRNDESTKKQRRQSSSRVEDTSSEQVEKQNGDENQGDKDPQKNQQNQKTENESENENTEAWIHIVCRLRRFIRYLGMIQRIGKRAGVDKQSILKPGKSVVQDRSSGQGRGVHAAHVIRGGMINENLAEPWYTMVKNILGHTQNVPQWVNLWKGIGGDIDRLQEEYISKIMDIDFSGDLDREIFEIMQKLKAAFLEIIVEWLHKYPDGSVEKAQLKKAKEEVEKLTIEDLFDAGKAGQRGDYDNSYKPKGCF